MYKAGQAGVTKATVTITFDNRDKNQSPVGYESYDELTVSRQVRAEGVYVFIILTRKFHWYAKSLATRSDISPLTSLLVNNLTTCSPHTPKSGTFVLNFS